MWKSPNESSQFRIVYCEFTNEYNAEPHRCTIAKTFEKFQIFDFRLRFEEAKARNGFFMQLVPQCTFLDFNSCFSQPVFTSNRQPFDRYMKNNQIAHFEFFAKTERKMRKLFCHSFARFSMRFQFVSFRWFNWKLLAHTDLIEWTNKRDEKWQTMWIWND